MSERDGGAARPGAPRVLVAGVGNVLRRDDGFGVAVAQRLGEGTSRDNGLVVREFGIGGIGLVQELFDGYDALIVLDAVQRDGRPGTLYLLEPVVPALTDLDENVRADLIADMHYAEPGRALTLARALGVLPPVVWLLGCQPADVDDLGIGLSGPVERAVEVAVEEVGRLIAGLLGGNRADLQEREEHICVRQSPGR